MHVGVGVSQGNEMTRCPNETWCEIDNPYKTITVSEGQPERIVCRIPSLRGRDILLLNQDGDPVLHDSRLSQYVKSVWDGKSGCNHTYHFHVTWTEDRDIQEKLRVIQCRANFPGIRHTYSSAMVRISFTTGEQGVSLLKNYVNFLPWV